MPRLVPTGTSNNAPQSQENTHRGQTTAPHQNASSAIAGTATLNGAAGGGVPIGQAVGGQMMIVNTKTGMMRPVNIKPSDIVASKSNMNEKVDFESRSR